MTHKFDVITIGRSSVDLYGAQVGGRLEEMGSFNKYIGGSPTNIACGTARLGLKSAIITAVGNEHMGRFIKEQLQKEGVSIQGVKTDPERLTALVLLGIRDNEQFPLIFYRENCADMGLTPEDIDAHFIASASCICATGTHLSHSQVEAATLKALRIARENKIKTALDIDYRPNLWGVAGHGEGESRFVESEQVTKKLQSTLGLFDLIVGTEEEFHIAGGTIDTIEALRNVRKISNATLICKRGPMGAAAFEGEIPDSLDEGQTGPGFKIDVFNVLGAGDGFMSGLLRGWLTGKQWPVALTYANACGALAVSRHGCTPAYPSWDELQFFLDRGIINTELRNDPELAQIHWSTNRPNRQNPLEKPSVRIFAFDHRSQMQDIDGATPTKIALFKKLCLQAAIQISAHNDGFGILCDERLGKETLYQASDYNLWIGRPAELPGSLPTSL
jgi:5-dehydro-2-deoxygluconokinase